MLDVESEEMHSAALWIGKELASLNSQSAYVVRRLYGQIASCKLENRNYC